MQSRKQGKQDRKQQPHVVQAETALRRAAKVRGCASDLGKKKRQCRARAVHALCVPFVPCMHVHQLHPLLQKGGLQIVHRPLRVAHCVAWPALTRPPPEPCPRSRFCRRSRRGWPPRACAATAPATSRPPSALAAVPSSARADAGTAGALYAPTATCPRRTTSPWRRAAGRTTRSLTSRRWWRRSRWRCPTQASPSRGGRCASR